jgi:hypothetical protein
LHVGVSDNSIWLSYGTRKYGSAEEIDLYDCNASHAQALARSFGLCASGSQETGKGVFVPMHLCVSVAAPLASPILGPAIFFLERRVLSIASSQIFLAVA